MFKKTLSVSALALIVSLGASGANAQRKNTAETSLVGIKLYDPAIRLLDLYGNPDDIEAINVSGTVIAGGGGGAPPAGGGTPPAGAGGGGGGGRGRGGGRGAAGADIYGPGGFEGVANQTLFQRGGRGPGGPGGDGDGGGPGRGTGGQGTQSQRGPGGAAGNPGGAPGAASGPTVQATFSRWIYKRGGGKYGFVLDKSNHVIQIEAVGLQNDKVKTRRGIKFGATFKQVMKTYGYPDSYDIGSNSITMRYLLKDKVIFRLNRLGVDKPHVVTGILVAAGKT